MAMAVSKRRRLLMLLLGLVNLLQSQHLHDTTNIPNAGQRLLLRPSSPACKQVPGTAGVLGQGAEEQKGETARLVRVTRTKSTQLTAM